MRVPLFDAVGRLERHLVLLHLFILLLNKTLLFLLSAQGEELLLGLSVLLIHRCTRTHADTRTHTQTLKSSQTLSDVYVTMFHYCPVCPSVPPVCPSEASHLSRCAR